MKNKYIYDSKEKITQKGLESSAATLLPEGSLLITSRATIGSIAIAEKQMATNQGFKKIVPNDKTNSLFYLGLSLEGLKCIFLDT